MRAERPDVPAPAIVQIDGHWYRLEDGARVVVAERPEQVAAAVVEVERAVGADGLFAAGYLAYEGAAGYGLTVHPSDTNGPPLLWFGLYRRREACPPPAAGGSFAFGPWRPSLDYADYAAAIAHIRAAIARGETYQANFTFHLLAEFSGDPAALFAALSAAQRAKYCAYLDLGRYVICSASPELFFRRQGPLVESRPMKGTAPRGLTLADDRAQIDWLRASEKNRAENVMIVDMIRNDLGRVARVGSVRVPALFAVERYPTLLQMTSTVTAETDATLADLLAATFPCASITGAPKVRTMRLLRELERGPRGVYTGAVGVVLPGGEAQFNVAIRTAVVDRWRGVATYGVGSGIVWDSDAAAEYQECLLKARVLAARPVDAHHFELLESLRWTPAEGYYLRERHLQRLVGSAEYFGFPLDVDAAGRCLDEVAASLDASAKVRVLVDDRGACRGEAQPLGGLGGEVRVGLAAGSVSSADVWLYHKTTHREVYDAARVARPDCDEVILWNERGELTEATTSNLVMEVDGRQYTPPVSSGLLAGTLRGALLDAGEIAERVLTKDDLSRATRLWLINSVRGWRPARLEIERSGD